MPPKRKAEPQPSTSSHKVGAKDEAKDRNINKRSRMTASQAIQLLIDSDEEDNIPSLYCDDSDVEFETELSDIEIDSDNETVLVRYDARGAKDKDLPKRKKTVYWCKTCEVFLCIGSGSDNCFESYHTKVDFWR